MDTYLGKSWQLDKPDDAPTWVRSYEPSRQSNAVNRPIGAADRLRSDCQVERGLRLRVDPGDRILRMTRSVALGTHHSSSADTNRAHLDMAQSCFRIVFQHSSVRLGSTIPKGEIATPNEVVLQDVGESSVRETLGPEGDDHCWIAIAPALLDEIMQTGVSSLPLCAAKDAFRYPPAPLSSRLFFLQFKLFSTIADPNCTMTSSQLDQSVIDLLKQILVEASLYWQRGRNLHSHARPSCLRRRLQIVEAAKSIMASTFCSDLSLAQLAETLHCSSAQLSRVFHRTTGIKLVDYRQDLRLRNGLFMLKHSFLDIGDIAVHLGFASHSHFTTAFCRSFGTPPSLFVKWQEQSTCPGSRPSRHYIGRVNSPVRLAAGF